MGLPISNNRYPFPFGYRGYVAFSGGAYIPWNGYNNGSNAPNNTVLGAVVQIVTSGVPTDTQSLSITGPDGKVYQFQFLYAATAGTVPGAITVRLPASGASTAAQVMTALLAILSLTQATTQGGTVIPFPWSAQTINATTTRINWLINGAVGAFLIPANMAVTIAAQPIIGQSGTSASRSICASAGKIRAFLPGP